MERAHYSPPWADTSIIGIAGSSGSGKSTLAQNIVNSLNLPWVAILSMVKKDPLLYKTLPYWDLRTPSTTSWPLNNIFWHTGMNLILTPQAQSILMSCSNVSMISRPGGQSFPNLPPLSLICWFRPSRRAEIPIYSFEYHRRLEKTDSIYSPHVLILEGIFALYDQRILDLLDLKIFAEADADVCLGRRSTSRPGGTYWGFQAETKYKPVTRDVRERGREIEGCIKQWMSFVKPNFERFVEPQRKVAGKQYRLGSDGINT